MAKQRQLNTKKGKYEWVIGVTEHESNFMPAVKGGKKRLDPGFENIYGYELLPGIVQHYRDLFNIAVKKKISADDLKRIDDGLLAYATSSTADNENLKLLKASILRSMDDNMLTHLYDKADDGVKQIMPPTYFENVDDLMEIDENRLIKAESINLYKKFAIKYTLLALKKFHQKLNNETEFETFEVARGQGNYMYYNTPIEDNRPDGLSVFTGIGLEGCPFFERQLLNSYSINRRVAEHFMVMGNNTRKYIIDTHIFHVLPNLFSSFVVCEYIDDKQYELLCIPNSNDLYIQERLNTDIVTEFILGEPPLHPIPDPTLEDIHNIADHQETDE